ncbi:hypothetical protein MTO96_051523 [Rhipicephalus appendiculatus]
MDVLWLVFCDGGDSRSELNPRRFGDVADVELPSWSLGGYQDSGNVEACNLFVLFALRGPAPSPVMADTIPEDPHDEITACTQARNRNEPPQRA